MNSLLAAAALCLAGPGAADPPSPASTPWAVASAVRS
jgi:hypothetical protein